MKEKSESRILLGMSIFLFIAGITFSIIFCFQFIIGIIPPSSISSISMAMCMMLVPSAVLILCFYSAVEGDRKKERDETKQTEKIQESIVSD